ncbi:phosphotransferase [Streptomyces sp. N35]|uniref:phosphotransferase n=1 Tax=Streptomyces sp. N35 TaxID=2795730 RepID=UPI0018F65228|nr:phosphotransferase [Streptomyces sp. N35]
MDAEELLGVGRSADVYALDDAWVLRRYRGGGDAAAEAVVMAYLAEHGYPVPKLRPLTAAGDLASKRSDLVMERLSGPSMREALWQGGITGKAAGVMLAALLRRLHTIPARLSDDADQRVLHLDLHPDNVMLTPRGPMVIDWGNVEEGPPGLDWAMSALILAQVAVTPGVEASVARAGLTAMLERRDRTVDLGDAGTGFLAQARLRRAADPNLTSREVGVLDRAVELVMEVAGVERG